MRILGRYLVPACALLLFATCVWDLYLEFRFFTAGSAGAVLALAAGIAAYAVAGLGRPGAPRHPRLVIALALGVVATLSIRLVGYDRTRTRSDAQWEVSQTKLAEQSAVKAIDRFAALATEARESARTLARSTPIALASEGSDAQDYLTGAFDALAAYDFPRAYPASVPGATLYDIGRRPLAWTGENISLEGLLQRRYGVPASSLFIVDQGVYTYLVAVEPLVSRLGFVSVEIPLAARRRLQNRYLSDYDALSTWTGREVDTEFTAFGDAVPSVHGTDVESSLFWDGPGDSPRLYFYLRDDTGRVLGTASFERGPIRVVRNEVTRQVRVASASVLNLAMLAALGSVLLGSRSVVVKIAAFWSARVVAFYSGIPLGLGHELDNPALYASSMFAGLARSPIDFLLTIGTLFATLVLVAPRVKARTVVSGSFAPLAALTGSLIATAALVWTNEVIREAWSNSSLDLASISPLPLDAARFTMQVGLVLLFLSAGVTCLFLLTRTVARRRYIALDGVAIGVAYWALSGTGMASHALLAIPVLGVARLASFYWERFDPNASAPTVYSRLGAVALLMLGATLSFYPAVAHFEDTTVRHFIETTVTPAVFRHGESLVDTMEETAIAIDRMGESGLSAGRDREDLAYRIWSGTNLVASSLSSSIEIVDENANITSRFAISLPPSDAFQSHTRAPVEWITETESIRNEVNHPGVLLTRRALSGPDDTRWELRVRLAADWQNLPFISAANPYLHLFRIADVDTAFRAPDRELSLFVLKPDGTTVFPTTGAVIRVDEDVLRGARRTPTWWDYTVSGQYHRAYLFSDGDYIFALSYPTSTALNYAAELAGWAILVGALVLVALGLTILSAPVTGYRAVTFGTLWGAIGKSFYGKLYIAFILIALIPIGSLAFFIRGLVIQQLQRNIEHEGIARAQVVARFVTDVLGPTSNFGTRRSATVSDAVLERVGGLASVDVDLYASGELVATSKPELFGSGLLRARAVPTAYRDLVLNHLTHSIHRESVGSFEYLVVSVPIRVDTRQEPGILAVPLASQEGEIGRRVATLNQALLLAALCFSAAAVAIAYSLARRIAGPINTLTDATHRVAEGDLDVSLRTTSNDEIAALITSFTQMAADLKRQRTDLERTKKLEAWAEMARQVAHEVKNPLTPIQLSAEHMLRVFDDPDVDFEKVLDECTETILAQVRSLRQISMEFSTFASPEPLKLEPTDIGALVGDTLAPYLKAPPEGVEIQLNAADGLPVIRADHRLMKRTLLNLIENALHAMNGRGCLRVEVAPTRDDAGHGIEVTVADDGVGIDAELQERIFEPYFSTRAAGTGLGLAIAKNVVEEHGGSIALDSRAGAGTRVILRFPADSPVLEPAPSGE